MRLVKPSIEIIEQQPGLQGIYKQIELSGRTCYQSSCNITEDSAEPFVNRMIKSGHFSVLEHATVYLTIPGELTDYEWDNFANNPYTKIFWIDNYNYITSNYRAIIENNWLDYLQYICEPTKYHEKRATIKFVCDRGVSHEFVRHRVFSFAQESTRFCNYSKDKFGNELTFIKPNWLDMKDKDENIEVDRLWNIDLLDICSLISEEERLDNRDAFLGSLLMSEYSYFNLLNSGLTPQQARAVLPNSLKTELIMTGFISDWEHFFSLRSPKYGAKGVHPDAAYLADLLYDEFIKRDYIKN